MLNSLDRVAFDGIRSLPKHGRTPRQNALLEALLHLNACEACPNGSSKPCEVARELLDRCEEEPDEMPTCCNLRRKIVVAVIAVLPEEQCGISEAEMADVIEWGIEAPSGKPVVAFRFCPWCGQARKDGDEVRITDIGNIDEDDDGA